MPQTVSHIVTGQAADADELSSQWLNSSGRLARARARTSEVWIPLSVLPHTVVGTIRLAAYRQSLFAPCPRRGQPREGAAKVFSARRR
jgi:hypothetical protein